MTSARFEYLELFLVCARGCGMNVKEGDNKIGILRVYLLSCGKQMNLMKS